MLNNIKPILIADIGAQGGPYHIFPGFLDKKRFDKLFFRGSVFNFIGIEPNEKEVSRLKNLNLYKSIFNKALFNKQGTHFLNLTKNPAVSSLLEPDFDIIHEYLTRKEWQEWFEVEKRIPVETDTLDNIFSRESIYPQLIKIDVQGVEYEIAQGGLRTLEKAIGIIAELSEVPVYKKQRTEKDFDSLMHKHGFIRVVNNFKDHLNIEKDVLYMKDNSLINGNDDLFAAIVILFIFNRDEMIEELLKSKKGTSLKNGDADLWLDYLYNNNAEDLFRLPKKLMYYFRKLINKLFYK